MGFTFIMKKGGSEGGREGKKTLNQGANVTDKCRKSTE